MDRWIKRAAAAVLAVLLIVACMGQSMGAGEATRVIATATPRPTQALELLDGERFTVMCPEGTEIIYGDNGTPTRVATGIAGYCE